MQLQNLSTATLKSEASSGRLRIRIGPFHVGVQTSVAQVVDLLALLYDSYPLESSNSYRDFQLSVCRPTSLRRWLRPYATFHGEGESPFAPLPLRTAFPLFEWGLNWSVATTAHQYLMLHAAVLEKDAITVLMPAIPGAGKSTLAAALMSRGWRLLSDEFGLVRPGTTAFVPFPRPIPLKNESTAVISEFDPNAVIGPVFRGTRKGDIAHCRPTPTSISRASEAAEITHIVFPRFESGSELTLTPVSKAQAFMKVSANSFNYVVLGERGFSTVARLVERSECHSLVYRDLEAAVALFEDFSR